ncbi:MAG: glycosyltransferase family 4 protein [Acidobacteria bacterium]|nr:glycosyltransferase family 4 protein [Acidobacteriota bacterium]
MTAKLKVLFIASDTGGCGYARCRLPALGLSELGGFEAKATARLAWDDLIHHDVLVWSRQHRRELVRYRKFARGMGKILVFDIDDHLHDLPSWSPAARAYPKGGPELRGLEEWMRSCDALTVSTPPLARAYGDFNRSVAVLPNSIDLDAWRPAPAAHRGIRVGWVGSTTHRKDLEIVKPALLKLLRRFPDVTLVMMGYDGDFQKAGIPLEYHPFVPIDEYPSKLASLSIDIALAPLSPHRFNTYKSNIKFLEYSALAVPCVASPVEPYLTIRDGETGFLAGSEAEWIEKIGALVEDAALRRRIGEAAREFVASSFDVRRTAHRWGDFFRALVAERPPREAPVAGAPLVAQLQLLRALEAGRDGRGPQALEHLRRAAEIDPLNATIRLLLAELLAASGDAAGAADEALNAKDLARGDATITERARRLLDRATEVEAPVAAR